MLYHRGHIPPQLRIAGVMHFHDQRHTPAVYAESADGSLASPALYSELHHIWAIDHTLMPG
jgi:hypothetical protein